MTMGRVTAQSGPRASDALPLAGSNTIWFHPEGLDEESTARLSAPRPDLCGLTLERGFGAAIGGGENAFLGPAEQALLAHVAG